MTFNPTPTDGEVHAAINILRDVRHLKADDVAVAICVAKALRAEREACAKIADGVGAVFYSASAEGRVTKSIAGQIRNRQ